jgi:serralysin
MYDDIVGGNNIITVVANRYYFLHSDAIYMYHNSKGGNDTIAGGVNSPNNYLYGESYYMYGATTGGADTLIGGADSIYNYLYGDAAWMYDNSPLTMCLL